MRTIGDFLQDQEMKRTGGMPQSADFHSKTYHRYFEGWSEWYETDGKGKKKIRRVYTGVLHQLDAPDPVRFRLRIAYILFYALALVLFLFAAFQPVGGNSAWYGALMTAVCIPTLVLTLVFLVSYLTAPREMTLYQYRSVGALTKATLFGYLSLGAYSIARFAYAFTHMGENTLQEVTGGAAALLAAALLFTIYLLEKKNVYKSFLSKNTAPRDAREISL